MGSYFGRVPYMERRLDPAQIAIRQKRDDLDANAPVFDSSIYVEPKGQSYYASNETELSKPIGDFFNLRDQENKRVCVLHFAPM